MNDTGKDRLKDQRNRHLFGSNQDPSILRSLAGLTFTTKKKTTDLNPNTLDYNRKTGAIDPVSDNRVRVALNDPSVNTTRVPLRVDQNIRFAQYKESMTEPGLTDNYSRHR